MTTERRILILGASYGALLGIKLVKAGHHVTLVCKPDEAALIEAEGCIVEMPVRGLDAPVTLRSQDAPGTLSAAGPDEVDPGAFDLVALAMQEPQYRASPVRALLQRIGEAGVPVMSIMNMPPLPYLERILGTEAEALRSAYTDPAVWAPIPAARMTLASPDPQAFRPPEEALNVLRVTLPTNFKVAAFEDAGATALLRQLEADIDAVREPVDGAEVALPVKLRVFDSPFVPLAKWAMLLTGNYRCVTAEGPRAIRDAVHSDPELSREVYAFVCDLCVRLGADAADMVPFEKYAKAAEGLAKPSSAARALFAGAPAIERVDHIVQGLARSRGLFHPEIDRTVALVDARLNATAEAA